MTLNCSLIIPVYNEEQFLTLCLERLLAFPFFSEVIFVDGGSTDSSLKLLEQSPHRCISSGKGRAIQCNAGAAEAKGEFLLFLHVDVLLPNNAEMILRELQQSMVLAANFRLQFDWPHWFLRLNAYFSYSRATAFQFGDQGLWIHRKLFERIGGYQEQMVLLEDQDIIRRIKKHCRVKKIKASLLVSARKYRVQGPFRLQLIYYKLYFYFRIGRSQAFLLDIWKNSLRAD